MKTSNEEQYADQSAEDMRGDQPSNLIPHDKDQDDDPWVLSRSFTTSQPGKNSSNHADERNLKKRNKSRKQHEDNQHASNLSLIILDEHKNLHIDSIDKIDNDSAIPGGMLHVAHNSMFCLIF
jgi:hypothetical protein